MKNTVVRRDKRVTLLLITGMLLMSLALFLNTHTQLPDFIKGLVYGIGLGLLVLFVWRTRKNNRSSTENQNA
jgi:multisubunit Na+/H+ antiporter MnhB subunit